MRVAEEDNKKAAKAFTKERQKWVKLPPVYQNKRQPTTSPSQPIALSASSAPSAQTALSSIPETKPVIPSPATTSPSTLVQSIPPSQSVAPIASSALSIIPATTHTSHTTNAPDMLYVTYENKTYPVHVEQSIRSRKANGGTRKHNSNKRKTRKRLH
jgi:hypothetical protein